MKLKQTIAIDGKSLMSEVSSWRWFHNFEPYDGGDIEFWVIFVIGN
jgi:hypothetical protein